MPQRGQRPGIPQHDQRPGMPQRGDQKIFHQLNKVPYIIKINYF
jgi:hypothetical protein